MAFNASVSMPVGSISMPCIHSRKLIFHLILQNMQSATSELWSAMNSQWKRANIASRAPQTRREPIEAAPVSVRVYIDCCRLMLHTDTVSQVEPLSLPESLQSVTSDKIMLGQVYRRPTFGQNTLRTAGMLVRASHTGQSSRHYSSLSTIGLKGLRKPNMHGLSKFDQQRFLFGGLSQNLLAQKERAANSNPNSANAQNMFYQSLLRANMPAIVVERHRTGQFASNAATEAIYLKALQRLGGDGAVQGAVQGTVQTLDPEQLQSVGQAVAARTHGSQVGISAKQPGTGAKESPLYVVVEESLGSSVFRWVKFFLYFGFFTYMSLVLVTILVETTGVLKNVRGTQSNEATPQQQKVRFSDVHGCDEAKDELQELVEFLLNPERFSTLGGKLPKGVLLVGPPGTGKTLLARAVAGEAGVPFFYMSGSEFDEVYVGVGAKRVRDLFNQARSKAPAIIFIDELDAIGAKRNERDAAYVKQTLNQLLTELDGFSQTSGVIILAATNYPQLLDKALTRPGRFDRRVVVGLPDVRGRMDILKHHMKNVQISTDVDVAVIARGTPGFSGADLENLVNQAAVHASRHKLERVGPTDFDWAKDKIMMGAEARSRIIQDKDKILTAYHEAGHALVAYFSPSATPLYKITIVPRGMALGITHFLPEMDTVSRNYTEYLSDIDVSMGGKAAEELIFGPEKVTSGISAVSYKHTLLIIHRRF
jgi:ATP-dependent metalloprotease